MLKYQKVIKLTRIYIIRHCEGEGNIRHIFNGTTDCDISDLGALQLDALAERFKDIPLDKAYASPLKRAIKTAKAVMRGKDIELGIDPSLIELYGGIVEGEPFKESFEKFPDLKDAWNNHPQDFHPVDAESMRDAYDRIYDAILRIAKRDDGKTVAIASHGGVIRCLLSRLIYGTIDKLKDVPWCTNTDVTLLEVENGEISLIYNSDHSHLPESLIPTRSKVESFVDKN